MVEYFYNLPIALATVLFLGTSLIVGLASSFGLRRVLKLESTEDDREHAVSLMQVVAAYIGILIAFAGVQVWQEFQPRRESECPSRGTLSTGFMLSDFRFALRTLAKPMCSGSCALPRSHAQTRYSRTRASRNAIPSIFPTALANWPVAASFAAHCSRSHQPWNSSAASSLSRTVRGLGFAASSASKAASPRNLSPGHTPPPPLLPQPAAS